MDSDDQTDFPKKEPPPKLARRGLAILRRPGDLPRGTNLLGKALLSPKSSDGNASSSWGHNPFDNSSPPGDPQEPIPTTDVTDFLDTLLSSHASKSTPEGNEDQPKVLNQKDRETQYRKIRAQIFGEDCESEEEEEDTQKEGDKSKDLHISTDNAPMKEGKGEGKIWIDSAQCYYFYPGDTEAKPASRRGRGAATGQQAVVWDDKYLGFIESVQNTKSQTPTGNVTGSNSPTEISPTGNNSPENKPESPRLSGYGGRYDAGTNPSQGYETRSHPAPPPRQAPPLSWEHYQTYPPPLRPATPPRPAEIAPSSVYAPSYPMAGYAPAYVAGPPYNTSGSFGGYYPSNTSSVAYGYDSRQVVFQQSAYPQTYPTAYPAQSGYPAAYHTPPDEPLPPVPDGSSPSPSRYGVAEGVYEDHRSNGVNFDEDFPPLD